MAQTPLLIGWQKKKWPCYQKWSIDPTQSSLKPQSHCPQSFAKTHTDLPAAPLLGVYLVSANFPPLWTIASENNMGEEDITLAQSSIVTWLAASGLCMMMRRRVTVDTWGRAKLCRSWGIGGRGKLWVARDMTPFKTQPRYLSAAPPHLPTVQNSTPSVDKPIIDGKFFFAFKPWHTFPKV